MYFDDHPPPHIHLEYQGHEAPAAIADGESSETKDARHLLPRFSDSAWGCTSAVT
jgi:hypothetical protein